MNISYIIKNSSFQLILYIYHLLLALYLHFAFNINIEADAERRWDWFWQNLPLELLSDKPLESLWNLHALPPLHNILMSLLLPISREPVQLLHLVHMFVGAGIAVLLYQIMIDQRINKRLAQVAGFIIATDPALLVFEAYPLYDLLSTFLLVASILCLSRYCVTGRNHYLLGSVAMINLLALERSTFHFAFVMAFIAFGLLIARGWRVKYMLVSFLITLPLIGVLSKNFVKFGFFGTSSWMGLSAWKITAHQFPKHMLEALVQEGKIPEHVVKHQAFSNPYLYSQYGYKTTSTITALSKDNFNNRAIVDISKTYGEAARVLITERPDIYAANVINSYLQFCRPTVLFKHVRLNGDRIDLLREIYVRSISGLVILRSDYHWTGKHKLISWHVVGFPIILLLTGIRIAFIHHRKRLWSNLADLNWVVPAYMAFLTSYVIAVSCLLETFEGDRYKLYIEHSFWALILIIFNRASWKPLVIKE